MDKQYSYTRALENTTKNFKRAAISHSNSTRQANFPHSVAVIARDQIITISLNYNTQNTQRDRMPFEKLTFIQLAKKIPFLRSPRVHFHVHKSPPFDPTFNQMNSVHTLIIHISNIDLTL
jgi:hypothetical protein